MFHLENFLILKHKKSLHSTGIFCLLVSLLIVTASWKSKNGRREQVRWWFLCWQEMVSKDKEKRGRCVSSDKSEQSWTELLRLLRCSFAHPAAALGGYNLASANQPFFFTHRTFFLSINIYIIFTVQNLNWISSSAVVSFFSLLKLVSDTF